MTDKDISCNKCTKCKINRNIIEDDEQQIEHQFDLSFPRTFKEIIIKIFIIFMINMMVFYIFNPFFYHRPRQVYKTKDYLYILYMAIIGTISNLIIAIIYIFLKEYVFKYAGPNKNTEYMIAFFFLIGVLAVFTIESLYVFTEEESKKRGWKCYMDSNGVDYNYI